MRLDDDGTLDHSSNRPSSSGENGSMDCSRSPTSGNARARARRESGVGNREITPWPHSRSPWLTWFLQQGSYPAVTSTCVANPGGHLKKSEYQQSHDVTPERPIPLSASWAFHFLLWMDCMMWAQSNNTMTHMLVALVIQRRLPSQRLLTLRPTSLERMRAPECVCGRDHSCALPFQSAGWTLIKISSSGSLPRTNDLQGPRGRRCRHTQPYQILHHGTQ